MMDWQEEDLKYITQVFSCIDPILRKFVQTKEQEATEENSNN